jgi:RNA polymerase sigma-70 factor, ECF subfamily
VALSVQQSNPNLPAASEGLDPAEAELVRRAQDGHSSAFDELVRKYSGRILNFIHQMTRQRQDAEDLAQQTFIKAYRNLDRFDRQRPLGVWLFTIARRTALNHFRGAKKWTELPEELPSRQDSPARQAEISDRVSNLWERARRILPERQYEILWLKAVEELSIEQIAEVTGLTETHVKVLIHRARQQLMKGESPS